MSGDKPIETPVADGGVEEAAVYVESWSTIQRSACLNDVADKSLSIASLLRRQARENANLAEGWHDAEVKLVEVEAKLSAALSLNSVETSKPRRAKPGMTTYCDAACTDDKCSETHERREAVSLIDS